MKLFIESSAYIAFYNTRDENIVKPKTYFSCCPVRYGKEVITTPIKAVSPNIRKVGE